MSAGIVRGDALSIPLRDESVDLIVTSPPYFALRSYRDGDEHYEGQIGSEPTPQAFLEALWSVLGECWRVLKPSGSCWVNLGDKRSGSGGGNQSGLLAHRNVPLGQAREAAQAVNGFSSPRRYNQAAFGRAKSKMLLPHRFAIGCEDGLADPEGIGWIVRQDQVWSKPNGLPESVKDRTRDSHEFWFHLCKSGDYYARMDEVRQPYAAKTFTVHSMATVKGERGDRSNSHRGSDAYATADTDDRLETLHPNGALPASVWSIATEPLVVPAELGVDHFAAFPTEWPRRLILGWSPPEGVVLDPFGGTGTTAMCARALGRFGVSLDLSADYCRLARWRIFDSPGASKVRTRTNAAAQAELFVGAQVNR